MRTAFLKVVHIAQIGLSAVAQAALEPALSPLDGAGDGGLVHPHALTDLPHIFPLGVVQQQHLPLFGGYVLPQGANEVALQPADLLAVVRRNLAAVHGHIGGVQLPLSISCIWHSCDTPCRNSAL